LLEIAFDSRLLRTICESEALAKRELGSTVAEALKHRLADMRAATSVKDLLVGHPRVLDGTNGQHMIIDLYGGYQIIFCANHPNNPVMEAGTLDWLRVSRIKLLRIERNHV
jgi:proteic killer suppression protein